VRGVELVYGDSGELAYALERGSLDAALIPSIEYLRGVGEHYVNGPALVATGRTGSLLFATEKPLEKVRRVAVDENSRTTLAVLRIVLDKSHKVLPDFMVCKAGPRGWQDTYDGVLLEGDAGLAYKLDGGSGKESYYDVAEMWSALHSCPLVVSVWAYNDERLGAKLAQILGNSRDYGLRNLSKLSEGVAPSTPFDGSFLLNYFQTGWRFDMGQAEENSMRILERCALEYQLIHEPRFEPLTHEPSFNLSST
jgi:chorismate dehydratase